MPEITLLPDVALTSSSRHQPTFSDNRPNTVLAILEAVTVVVDESLPRLAEASVKDELSRAISRARAVVGSLPRNDWTSPEVTVARDLVRKVASAGVAGLLTPDSGAESGMKIRQKDWPVLLARMLGGSPWLSPVDIGFEDVPDWLWGDFSVWVFSAPRTFIQLDEADIYAAHMLRRMDELARWVSRNFGSAAVRAALDGYRATFSFLPLAVSQNDLRRHAEIHGRLVTAGLRANTGTIAVTGSREGRPLRVAFIASKPSLIPEFSRLLASDRFEISLYVFDGADEANGSGENAVPFAILSLMQAGNRARQYQGLASDLADQLSELQTANFDAVIFCEELAASDGRLHRLASHRLAPLHVFTQASISSGLPGSDLVLLGEDAGDDEAIKKAFSERISFTPGSGMTFADIPSFSGDRRTSRANLKLPTDAFFIMTAARMLEITPQLRAQWIDILKADSKIYLGIQLLHTGELSNGVVEWWAAGWDEALVAAGINTDRLLVFGSAPGSLVELQHILSPADLFLDIGAFGEADLLNVPFSLSLPIVTTEGNTVRARRGAALLRSLHLDRLIAHNESDRCALVLQLARNRDEYEKVTTQMRAQLERLPLCRDQLAAAESISAAIERAYDDLHAKGHRAFREGSALTYGMKDKNSVDATLRDGEQALAMGDYVGALRAARDVLRVVPNNVVARRIAGRARLGKNEYSQAVELLLATAEAVDDAGTWYSLAVALYHNSQKSEAVQALETTLRIDPHWTDAWALLVELASEVGANDLARDAFDALVQLAPHDTRVGGLRDRLQAT